VIRRRTVLCMLAAAGFTSALTAVPAAATDIERVVSPGGIEAWLVRDRSLPLIAMNFSFLGGSNQDSDDKAGLGNMVAALLDEGAGEMDSRAFQQRVEETAVQIRFSVTRDYFYGSVRMLRERMDESLDLVRLAIEKPRFDADAIARVQAQTLAGLRRESTDPNKIASRTWWDRAFASHPYGRPSAGTIESVATISAGDLRSYAGRVLTRATVKVAVVGDIDAATLGKTLDRVFGGLPAKADLRPVPERPLGAAGRRIVSPLDVPQSVVLMGGVGISRKDKDFIPAFVVNHILGGGSFTSRLYEEVREKRGLAYGVYSYLLPLRHSALFMVSTQASADRTAEAVELIESLVRSMADEGPTEEELAKAKAYLKGSYALNFDTSAKIANLLLQIQLDDLGIDYIKRRNELIDAVTIADARRAAKRIAEGGLFVTVVGRPKGLGSKDSGG
jgi:zinc protease